jgi:ABC-type antimicrobial peptide transport system permease subunit
MALGADRSRILRMLLRQGGAQVAVGLFAGLGLAVVATTLGGAAIGNILFSVDPHDPVIFTAVATLVTLVALVATLVPARRATRVDPMIALRSE